MKISKQETVLDLLNFLEGMSMKNVGMCDECGKKKYVNDHGYCKRCFKEVTNENLVTEE